MIIRNFKNIIGLCLVFCSACGTVDDYSFDMDKVPEESTVILCGVDDSDMLPSPGPDPKSKKAIKVKKAEDISGWAIWSSDMYPYYLDGIFVDKDYKKLVRASQLSCFNGTFDSLYFKYVKKVDTDKNYLKKYKGDFYNYKGDKMTLTNNKLSWDYTLNENCKVKFEISDFVTNNSFAPTANNLTINGQKIDYFEGSGFTIESKYCLDEEIMLMSGLKISFNLSGAFFDTYLNRYLESINSEYRFDGFYPFEGCYFRNNNCTINYDL